MYLMGFLQKVKMESQVALITLFEYGLFKMLLCDLCHRVG